MSELFAERPFPRGAVHAGLALVGMTILFAGFARLTDIGVTRLAPSPAIESQEFRFLDNPEGGVRVEGVDGRIVGSFGIGEGGFLRGVLRGFARDRRSRDMGSQETFTLARHQDGRLSLRDSASGRVVELDAFGPTNAGLFGKLLIQGRSVR